MNQPGLVSRIICWVFFLQTLKKPGGRRSECCELKGGRTRGIRSGNICPFYYMSLNGIGAEVHSSNINTLTNKSKYVKSFALHYTVVWVSLMHHVIEFVYVTQSLRYLIVVQYWLEFFGYWLEISKYLDTLVLSWDWVWI